MILYDFSIVQNELMSFFRDLSVICRLEMIQIMGWNSHANANMVVPK